ncbi:class I SAM-dependent methyltransferase [Clostridiales bacterium COT073_COT-073]|nr:class I SAM-dependent methyltransferase [Clostridiales bacterium COT073_COT-073]
MRELCVSKLTQSPQDMEKSNQMWNKRAKEFAANMKTEGQDPYMEFLKKQVDLNGKSILDVGCGAGKYMKLLLEEGAIVEGLEPSSEMVREAKKYLGESGYDAEKIAFHVESFQDFSPQKPYDYVFISNNPVISYYESYDKILKLAKQGIFIGSWMGNKDSLLEKVSQKLGVKAKGHGSQNIRYIFELLFEDGYYPSFDTYVQRSVKEVAPESLYQRYASWFYGAEYTEKEVQAVKTALAEYIVKNKVVTEVSSTQGMLFVDLKKRLD